MEDKDIELEIIRRRIMRELMSQTRKPRKKILVEVITSPGCPYCPIALRIAKEVSKKYDNVEVREISVVTPYGREKALKHNIMGTPTILIEDNVEFIGVPDPLEFEMKLKEYLKK